jgi:6,7-dimethyl-8-ribityllumazine synthase
MATALTDHSSYDPKGVPDGMGMRMALVVAEWNEEITHSLAEAARKTLLHHGVREQDLLIERVPGSYELALGAKLLIESEPVDAVICIGSVIRGETPHFEYVCQATAQGIMDVNLSTGVPTIFCVLTDDTIQQARDRSGGKHGNKGVDCAVAALKMAAMRSRLRG